MTLSYVYLSNLAVSLYLMGLIWTIQMVHYPTFRFVDRERFLSFSHFHQQGMTYIVGPVMIIELLLSLSMFLLNKQDLKLLSLLLIVLLTWVFTFYVSVPLHNKLLQGYDVPTIEKLIVTNWPRTFLWTLKVGLMFFWIGSYAKIQ